MSVLICPGFHSPQLTQSFLQNLKPQSSSNWLIFPAPDYPPYSSLAILKFLEQHYPTPSEAEPLLFIAFSAGVVGAMGAAIAWQLQAGKVKGLLALDGWGVPLGGNFPVHRLSHDYFTYWSSALLGPGEDSFYAEPPVGHLDLWRSPQTVLGWWLIAPDCRQRCAAVEFLGALCRRYQETVLPI